MLRSLFCALVFTTAAFSSASAQDIALEKTDYPSLKGWVEDDVGYALSSFQRSCNKLVAQKEDVRVGDGKLAGTVKDWQAACQAAVIQNPSDIHGARYLFENHFTPYIVKVGGTSAGKLTGYYEPLLKGSLKKKDGYAVPVYGRPADLPKDGSVYPLTRKEIENGALAGKGLEKLYVSSAIDLFFLQVQGSGRVKMDTGETLALSFDGKNNQPYTSLGKLLIEKGVFTLEEVNAPAIRKWLKDNPKDATALMQQNASYVFFAVAPSVASGPVGAQNAVLTPERSMAVDARYIPLGTPVFLNTSLPVSVHGKGEPYNRLLIAQDKGSAILGAMRGDVFFGFGDRAEDLAGFMNSAGTFTVLVPNPIAQRLGTGG